MLFGLDLIFARSGRRNAFELRCYRGAAKACRSHSNGLQGTRRSSLWLQKPGDLLMQTVFPSIVFGVADNGLSLAHDRGRIGPARRAKRSYREHR
jgi:hypothetical protein